MMSSLSGIPGAELTCTTNFLSCASPHSLGFSVVNRGVAADGIGDPDPIDGRWCPAILSHGPS